MTIGNSSDDAKPYRIRLGARRTLTLPAELCQELGVSPGDVLDVYVDRGKATILPRPKARGILRGYFSSWEEVNRFVEEERSGWQERETRLQQSVDPEGS
jgi:bifunctional DNA-binding transcriptional regulator/antitoxin component of YhaV-PrlF toxin-antitoxin module